MHAWFNAHYNTRHLLQCSRLHSSGRTELRHDLLIVHIPYLDLPVKTPSGQVVGRAVRDTEDVVMVMRLLPSPAAVRLYLKNLSKKFGGKVKKNHTKRQYVTNIKPRSH